MADKRIPLSGGGKILPGREDLEVMPFSFFSQGKRGRGAVVPGGIPNPLVLPYTFNFDAETTGQPCSFATDRQDCDNIINAEAIEGHAKVCLIQTLVGSGWTSFDFGGSIDPNNGIRIQWLMHQNNLYAWAWCYLGLYSEADDRIIYILIGENATSYRARSLVRNDLGVTEDTGELQPGGGLNGTGNNWRYRRYEWNPATGFEAWSISTVGGGATGYPKTQAHSKVPLLAADIPSYVDSVSFYSSDGWMDMKIAELWIGSLTDAWPTAGQPTS